MNLWRDERGLFHAVNVQFLGLEPLYPQSAIDALQANVEQLTKERDAAIEMCRNDNEEMWELLSASQLECKQLREAHHEVLDAAFNLVNDNGLEGEAAEAIEVAYHDHLFADDTDTTALDAYVKQEQAKMLREMAVTSLGEDAGSLSRRLCRKADELMEETK